MIRAALLSCALASCLIGGSRGRYVHHVEIEDDTLVVEKCTLYVAGTPSAADCTVERHPIPRPRFERTP